MNGSVVLGTESLSHKPSLTPSDTPVVVQADRSSVGSDSVDLQENERGGWGGKVEFILTCIGFAVGLGNVWRFPYLCYANGGGAFLIPYLLTLGFVGLPLFFMELCFGQFASLGPITIWRINLMFKGVGFAMVIISTYVICYYNVIVAWCLYFFFASMTTELPWTYCNNWWNTPACIDSTMNVSQLVVNGTINGSVPKTSSEEYFYNNVLRMSPGLEYPGGMVWQLTALLLFAWLIIFVVLLRGINSVGKASYFVSLFPYVLLTIMLGQVTSLPGAREGARFYMSPDWERLGDAKVWSDAATQIFYSLGVGMGGLIAMASYNRFDNNVLRDSLIVPFVNCGTSIYAGFVVFCTLGYIANEKGVSVDDVATDGPGLVFVVYPEGLATMPVAPLWSTLFFFMMSTLGFSSQFSMTEGACAALMDEFPNFLKKGSRPTILRFVYCTMMFLLGLPMVTGSGFYMFKIMDDYSAGYPLLLVGFLEFCAIAWIYGLKRFGDDINLMIGKDLNCFWVACWLVISPVVIALVFIFKAVQQGPLTFGEYVYPPFGSALAWMIAMFPIVVIVALMLYQWCIDGGFKAATKASSPQESWGPSLAVNRTGRYAPEAARLRKITGDHSSLRSRGSASSSSAGTSSNSCKKDEKALFTVNGTQEMQPPPAYNGLDMSMNHKMGFENKGYEAMGDYQTVQEVIGDDSLTQF